MPRMARSMTILATCSPTGDATREDEGNRECEVLALAGELFPLPPTSRRDDTDLPTPAAVPPSTRGEAPSGDRRAIKPAVVAAAACGCRCYSGAVDGRQA